MQSISRPIFWLVFLTLGLSLIMPLIAGPTYAQQQGTVINAGEVVTDVLEQPGEHHRYFFAGAANQSTSLSLWAGGDLRLDPFLTLLASDGTVIAEDDNSGDGSNAYLEMTLPAEGIYSIVVAGSAGTTGWYGLQLNLSDQPPPDQPPPDQPPPDQPPPDQPPPDQPPPAEGVPQGVSITPGVGVVGQIETAGAEDYYAFQAGVGQGIQLAMWTGTNSSVDPLVVLLDPTGAVYAQDDNGAGTGGNSYMRVVAETQGTYTIVARGANNTVGAYGLQLDFFTPAGEPTPAPEPAPEPAPDPTPEPDQSPPPSPSIPPDEVQPIAPGVPMVDRIAEPGAAKYYSFNGGQGQRIALSMWNGNNSNLDSHLMLVGPDGAVVVVDDNGAGSGLNAYREVELPVTGTFVIVASGANGTTGTFGLVFDFL